MALAAAPNNLSDLRQALDNLDFTVSLAPTLSFASALGQLREVFYSLLVNFRASFLGKVDTDLLPMTTFRGWRSLPMVYSLFQTSTGALRQYCSEMEVLMLIRESVANLCECVVRELRLLGVTRSGLAWIRDTHMMLEDTGRVFQGLGYRFIPRDVDLLQLFLLVFYEKIERDRMYHSLLELASEGTRLLEREVLDMRVRLARLAQSCPQPKPFKVHPPVLSLPQSPQRPKDTSSLQRMSLDALVQYINKPADSRARVSRATTACTSVSPQQHNKDDLSEEIRQFRLRLEKAPGRDCRLKPTMSEDWLQRLQSRLHCGLQS
jgi:hypothetical protein